MFRRYIFHFGGTGSARWRFSSPNDSATCRVVKVPPSGKLRTIIAHLRMTTETKITRLPFLAISTLTIILSGFFTLMNLVEFYNIDTLNKTDDYSFGGEGPTPYYYKSAGLYSTVHLVWGLIFLTTLLFTIRTTFKGDRKKIFCYFL